MVSDPGHAKSCRYTATLMMMEHDWNEDSDHATIYNRIGMK